MTGTVFRELTANLSTLKASNYRTSRLGGRCLKADIPHEANLRGTYAGLATAPIIEHLTRLGVTSIELMPVHSFVDDRQLVERGLRNYWGYNSIGFFAPEPRYLATACISEFKTMVKTLHSAGLEGVRRRLCRWLSSS